MILILANNLKNDFDVALEAHKISNYFPSTT
jgi:hypothetical protein